MVSIKNLLNDIRAFADDENEVTVEKNGEILFTRFGREIHCRFKEDSNGNTFINTGDEDLPYSIFISRELARLDVFAERIISRHSGVDTFINSPGILESPFSEPKQGASLELLSEITDNPLPFATRIVFITADAGQGKTVLLKQMQYLQALKFISNKSHFLFWHVDLQGRQLLRLNEALLGDLGELRISGLYMQSIITLMRHGLIVLAIDGFDELAAEQGSNDALGSLSHIVKMLENSGTIIAASRRAFFDAEEYIKRTKLLSASVSRDSQYDQLRLNDWTKNENIRYLEELIINGKKFNNVSQIFNDILQELKNDENHPMLNRPFLFTQIARILLLYDLSPSEFIGKMENPLESVGSLLEAFIHREVTQKWKMRETGKPYLTHEQHVLLLSQIAEEMWYSQKEKIRLELIEEILSVAMDDLNIAYDIRLQIFDIFKMHALLIPIEDNYDYRKFEHPEFKNYFISHTLKNIIVDIGLNGVKDSHVKFLSIARLHDSVAKYASSMIEKKPSVVGIILKNFEETVNNEWKPTYLQTNIGTIIPYLVNQTAFEKQISFAAKVVYSSLIFEQTAIQNIIIKNGRFVKTSFMKINWKNVIFEECEFNEAIFDHESRVSNVIFKTCRFNSIIICKNGEEITREYSPQRIISTLSNIGFSFDAVGPQPVDSFDISEERKILLRFFNIFRKTTRLTDNVLRIMFAHNQFDFALNTLIPIAEQFGILRQVQWKERGAARSWLLQIRVEDILKGQDINDNSSLGNFWRKMRNIAGTNQAL
ncbi:MAG: NACHT domain-containing protein [Desulfobacteraceae bacterium]|nr:NACHT domain-containing protein [Desulfobacteraceae bacterium]